MSLGARPVFSYSSEATAQAKSKADFPERRSSGVSA